MSYQRDLWKEIKTAYLKQVQEALSATGHTDMKDMLDDLDTHLEQKYMDLTLEEKCIERFEKIITQMGPASDYAEFLKQDGSNTSRKDQKGTNVKKKINAEEPAKASAEKPIEPPIRKVVIVPIESQYDDQTMLTKAKWLGLGILAAAGIAIFVWKNQNNNPEKIGITPQTPTIQSRAPAAEKQNDSNAIMKNPDLDLQTYIVKFTTASEVNAISARELFAMFNAKEPPKIKTHHFKTEIQEKMLIGLICVDNKNDLDATTGMLLSSNDLKLVNVEPGTEDNLRDLYAMGQPSLTIKPAQVPAVTAPVAAETENKTSSMQAAEVKPSKPSLARPSGPPVLLISNPAMDNIRLKETNARIIKSFFGNPERIDMNGRLLRYTSKGIDFLFSFNGQLSEIHVNGGFEGRLDTGISINSTQGEVFKTYGDPVKTMKAFELRRRNNEAVLWVKGDTSRIYYGKWGLVFWFQNGLVSQIIVFQGVMEDTEKESGAQEGPEIQSWTENGRTVDRINYPFVLDTDAVGRWTSVDLVDNIEDFDPGRKAFGGNLVLTGIVLNKNGSTSGPWSWTKGIIMHPDDRTASRYIIKDLNGTKYMFFEWKSGDYIFRNQKPSFYVLKKQIGK